MINKGITNGTHGPTADTKLSDLNNFQIILLRNFKDKFTH